MKIDLGGEVAEFRQTRPGALFRRDRVVMFATTKPKCLHYNVATTPASVRCKACSVEVWGLRPHDIVKGALKLGLGS